MRPRLRAADGVVAAGPNNVVELTNIVGRIFDKSGNDLSDFNLNTFFGVATDIFSSDPRIEYDTLSQRWFISFLTFDTTDPSNCPKRVLESCGFERFEPDSMASTLIRLRLRAIFRISRRSDSTTTRW